MNTTNTSSAGIVHSKILVVSIIKHGADKGVFVNGTLVLSADPSCGDDTSLVFHVAKSLSVALHVDAEEVDVSPDDGWTWDDIKQRL